MLSEMERLRRNPALALLCNGIKGVKGGRKVTGGGRDSREWTARYKSCGIDCESWVIRDVVRSSIVENKRSAK
jgi:hypothetical protein